MFYSDLTHWSIYLSTLGLQLHAASSKAEDNGLSLPYLKMPKVGQRFSFFLMSLLMNRHANDIPGFFSVKYKQVPQNSNTVKAFEAVFNPRKCPRLLSMQCFCYTTEHESFCYMIFFQNSKCLHSFFVHCSMLLPRPAICLN